MQENKMKEIPDYSRWFFGFGPGDLRKKRDDGSDYLCVQNGKEEKHAQKYRGIEERPVVNFVSSNSYISVSVCL